MRNTAHLLPIDVDLPKLGPKLLVVQGCQYPWYPTFCSQMLYPWATPHSRHPKFWMAKESLEHSWDNQYISHLKKNSFLTQMATHSTYYVFLFFSLIINSWLLTQIGTQKGSSFFFVAMWFSILWRRHQSLIYGYLRCPLPCLIRNCDVIINFKHMPFYAWEDKYEWYFLELQPHGL